MSHRSWQLYLWQVGELGGRRAIATDDVADENERLAAEVAAMQAQLNPNAPRAAGLMAPLELPQVILVSAG